MDMGTQGSGRKRLPNRERLTAEDDALNQIAREAEARLAAKRAARAEAREIRMKELERQQKETNGYDGDYCGSQSLSRRSGRVEERPDKDFTEKGSRNMPSLSAATLASLGGTSSRRGSGDTSISMDTEASIREIKDSLAEVEEKYKKAMVSNAQLDNEKTNFMYQVDTLKDMLLELEEQLAESQRQYEEKNKEFEREKHAHSILQFQFAEVKEALRQREEMLEKHGIILNSEIATNGETSDTLNGVGYQGPTKMTKEELNALKSAGEGTLGKAKEVELKKEIVQSMGKGGGTLQNTEQQQPRPNPIKDCVDQGVSHPGENAQDQKPTEDSALSPGPLAGAKCEQQVRSQAQENTSFLKDPEQIESREVTDQPDGRTRNSLEQSNCLGGLDSEESGPAALGIKNQSENSIGLGQTSEGDEVSCTDSRDAGGNHTENVVQAATGEQVGTVASGPLEHHKDTVSHDRRSVNEGAEQSLERELSQEVAEPEEALIQSPPTSKENTVRKTGDKKPIQAEVQATTGAPIVQSGHQDTSVTGATHAPLDEKEPGKEKSEQQAEALDSPQKKSKNRKKKNKKKKPPASVETCKDASKELNCQNTDAHDLEEEESIQFPDKKQTAETQSKETKNPEQKITAGSSEHVECLEDAENESNGKQNQGEEDGVNTRAGDGDTLMCEADAAQSVSTSAEGEETEERDADDPAGGPRDVLDQNSPQCKEEEISPMKKKGPPKRGSEEGHVLSQHPGQMEEKAIDGCSIDNSDLSGELGGCNSESGVQARGEVENSKSKEDCTMS
ncbi:leucine-rich repeat flightless-interacting protein 1 isoform X25 [Cricetulus griseus]|uniref:Leucine-rich repeat flightless-interacting protein 1 isoform X25 n=1 Tax=Cricetulus griseus TaxID=10029 RepID=A0A9J7GRT5_CRIGR|nr:leucine-rich repeat flightless-interacting protein 1 isoform X25 [Cricetulus griseus]